MMTIRMSMKEALPHLPRRPPMTDANYYRMESMNRMDRMSMSMTEIRPHTDILHQHSKDGARRRTFFPAIGRSGSERAARSSTRHAVAHSATPPDGAASPSRKRRSRPSPFLDLTRLHR